MGACVHAAVPPLLNWSALGSVETSYGYNDNLLLSSTSEERSAFARASVEVLVMRVPRDQFDFSTFLQVDGTRFFSGETVDHEARAWLRSEPGYRIGEKWNLTLPVTGYYSDEVYDVSATEVDRFVAELKVAGVMVGPTVRWDVLPAWWLEAQAVGERKSYYDGSNDGDVGEGTVRAGWTRGGIEARVAATRRWRDFRSRTQYNRVGRQLLGTHLKIAERAGEAQLEIAWDEAKRWRTVTQANVLYYEDNGSGYFNFREQKIGQDLEWENDRWHVRLGASAARLDYRVQTVDFGTEPPARLRDEFAAELRIERALSPRWRLVAGYRWERSRSNDPIASYVVNEGLLGVRWSWDK